MNISIIVAISNNHVIGVENQLPWHLPADLAYFKSLTIDHPIIMGRKTYDSIGRPLPKRTNIVITRDSSFQHENLVIKNSIQDAIQYCEDQQFDEVFIIGGDTIYKQTLHLVTKLYITRVNTIIENGTAYFPEVNLNEWNLVSSIAHGIDEKNAFEYIFELYEKIEP